MKKFRFSLTIILIVVVCCSCLVACDFNNSQGSGNDNESNIEQDNGEIITPGDKEDGTQTEIPSEPEPEPPVEPEEPEKPVDPTPDEDKELDISGFSDKLSEWNKSQVANLIKGFTSMYGQELFTEKRGGGVLYYGFAFSIVGLQLDKNSKSINTLIKYSKDGDFETDIRFAEKTMTFNDSVNLLKHIKEISKYEELFVKDNIKTPEKLGFTVNKSTNYTSIVLNRNNELDGSRMDELTNIINSFEQVDMLKQVLYSTISQGGYLGDFGGEGIRWYLNSYVITDQNYLQQISFIIALPGNSKYQSPDKIFEFGNDKTLIKDKDYKFISSTITSDKTFGGENAVFQLPAFYEN